MQEHSTQIPKPIKEIQWLHDPLRQTAESFLHAQRRRTVLDREKQPLKRDKLLSSRYDDFVGLNPLYQAA